MGGNITNGLILILLLYPVRIITANIPQTHALFKIERSKDSNEIHYAIHASANMLDKREPVSVFWLKRQSGMAIEPLTWIQKKYAYGLKFISVSKTNATFQFVSYNKRNFEVQLDRDGRYKVFTLINQSRAIVDRIYIQMDGGTFWFPIISRVSLYAHDANTGAYLVETIIP